ncbi:MAG: PDZ domain-containing protein [Thermoguttaceae bacterium]
MTIFRSSPGRLVNALAVVLGAVWASAASGPEDLAELEQQAFRAAVQRVAPSVVRIETGGGLERVGRVLLGTGPTTGLVLTADGYIVSSAFNFLHRPAVILVQLPDGTRKPARSIATDHNRMVTLLKIEPDKPLAIPEIAPAEQIRVGQWAIAVGRTFQTDQPNLAVGLVSATGRVWGKAIQTDAAVSPNNYGGPLVDIRGRVLGLLVPLSPEQSNQIVGVQWYDSGIGFAVPAQTLMELLPRLKQGKDLFPGLAGIEFPAEGLYTGEPVLSRCRPRSPAHKAGLRAGDRILAVDGQQITRPAQLRQELGRRYAGDKVHLAVLRDGKRIEREVELVAKLEPYEHPFLGILPMRGGAEPPEKRPAGLPVRYVFPESPAAKAGLQPGDVLLRLNGHAISDADQLRTDLGQFVPGETVRVEYRRGRPTRTVELTLAPLPETLPSGQLPPAHGPPGPAGAKPPAAGRAEMKSDKTPHSAVCYVPATYRAGAAFGLVVWLHGPGGLDEKGLLEGWGPLCDQYELILLAPRSADSGRWTPGDLMGVLILLAELRSKYSLDPARLVVSGYQAGGEAALALGLASRSPFRAVAVVEAASTGPVPENEPEIRRAFFVAAAQQSPAASQTRQMISRLRAARYPVTVKDLGLQPRQLSPDELAELARWIDTLDRI